MPATDYHQEQSSSSSSSSPSNFGLLNRRRDQVHAMDSGGRENQLDSFQRQVSERFQALANSSPNEFLSIEWIRKLLDAFLSCQEDFKGIVFNNKDLLNRPPMERYISDYFERSVKALDVCNAIRDGIEQIRQWHKQLEIILCALDNQRSMGEGQFRRSKKALNELAIGMLDEKESNATTTTAGHRNRSFGRSSVPREVRSLSHFRSLSWSVSRTWSASRQLQAISNTLVAPKANEIAATYGLNVAVFTMNYVLLFVMWALVAAIPCQDRGLQTHFLAMRQFEWALPIFSLHEKILEESKKRDRRNSPGLLKEIHEIEKCARHMNELTDNVKFPLTEEKEREVKQRVKEVVVVFETIRDGLDPLERQVREVFHRIVRNRTNALDVLGRPNTHG